MTPFVVLALPRSRTFWLSRFLSHGAYQCGHEQARYVRGIDDIRSWLAQDFVGSCETAAAPWWRLIRAYRPDARIVVVRRHPDDVLASLDRVPGTAWSADRLAKAIHRYDRALGRVAPHALVVRYEDLDREETCAGLFEYCTGQTHDQDRWVEMTAQNLQCDLPALLRYARAHAPQLARAADLATRAVRGASLAHPVAEEDGLVIQEETMATAWRDAEALMAAHCAAIGEAPETYKAKNWPLLQKMADAGAVQIMTARLNGRMLGYLSSIISPSLEAERMTVCTQLSLFASEDAKGLSLGARLQRASITRAWSKGVDKIFMKAGDRGSGPELGVLYRRFGAKEIGQLYCLERPAA